MSEKQKKLAHEWIDRAWSDFQYAQAGEKETQQHHITCFLCHQAVEKAVKAMLIVDGIVPTRSHHLGFLFSQILDRHSLFASIQMDVRKLDKFYIPARYPDDVVTTFTAEDARLALQTAEKMLRLVEETLSS